MKTFYFDKYYNNTCHFNKTFYYFVNLGYFSVEKSSSVLWVPVIWLLMLGLTFLIHRDSNMDKRYVSRSVRMIFVLSTSSFLVRVAWCTS